MQSFYLCVYCEKESRDKGEEAEDFYDYPFEQLRLCERHKKENPKVTDNDIWEAMVKARRDNKLRREQIKSLRLLMIHFVAKYR